MTTSKDDAPTPSEVKALLKAAEQGDLRAQAKVGNLYFQGHGVPQDAAEAVRWYRLAADQGYAPAQYNLGLMYDVGESVPQDDEEAVRWFRLAADQGFAGGQLNLGVMYSKGRGVPQDDAEAFHWIRLAADRGEAEAQFNLGIIYHDGRGVPQDDVEAIRWFRLAADQGHASAQSNLNVINAKGLGLPQRLTGMTPSLLQLLKELNEEFEDDLSWMKGSKLEAFLDPKVFDTPVNQDARASADSRVASKKLFSFGESPRLKKLFRFVGIVCVVTFLTAATITYGINGALGTLTAVIIFVFLSKANSRTYFNREPESQQELRDFWKGLSGVQFELELADLLRRAGYSVLSTPASDDGGIDLRLSNGNTATIVQCKRHQKPAGPAIARELYGTLMDSDADEAILACTAGVSQRAREFLEGKPILIMDVDDIVRLQKHVEG